MSSVENLRALGPGLVNALGTGKINQIELKGHRLESTTIKNKV
jgi:hypothetical protein